MAESASTAPSANPAGQAHHTIAGFRYQILQSMLALLHLRPGDELWLEVSEDYSVVSEEVQTDVQVKNSQAVRGPPSYSLQSRVIKDAIIRFWDNSRPSSEKNRRLVFLARGGASKERGHSMPGGVPGLAYWQSAATDADTQPLRTLLFEAFEGSSVAEWLASHPSDDQLRDQLLRRISWQLEERPSDAIRLEARDQIRSILRAKNLLVSAAELAVDALISFIFEAASKADASDRKLVLDDLETQLDRVAGQKWVVEQRLRAPVLAENLLVSQVRTSPAAAQRRSTVEELIGNARGQAVIWLYGTHGIGKSTLARLIAQALGGNWVVLDLGPVQNDPMGAISAWTEVAQRAMAGELNGIIVDNVVDQAGEAIIERMAALSGTFFASGGRVVATSHQQPLPMHLAELGVVRPVAAPYFSDDDVIELVAQQPSPPEEMLKPWAVFLRMSTSGGHPSLVSTKLASLRARDWPLTALMEDIDRPGEATTLTRESFRRKLIRELQELDDALSLDARQLMRRIANVFDRVDEKLVLLLAQQEPALRNAGDALALLKGTWLETLPQGDLRVSPLVSDIGGDVGIEEGRQLKRLAAVHWMKGRVLDERTLPLCFWNAFWGKHDGVLTKLSETMQGLSAEKLRAAAPMLSPLALLVTDKEIYDGHPIAAISVRVLQFAVADALDNQDVSTSAAQRLIVELDQLPDRIRPLLTSTSMFRVLLAEADLTPAIRIECARRLRSSLPLVGAIVAEMSEDFPDPNRLLPPQLRPDMDVADFLMTRLVQKVRSTEKFIEALRALADIGARDRDRYLDAISLMYGGLSVFVSSGWSGDQLEGKDMDLALEGYGRATTITQGWGRADIAIELEISKSVILDESLDRKDDALTIIEEAIERQGPSPGAIRQKARVLSHQNRHEEAANLTLSIEDELSPNDTLERALALRDGAVSLGRIGEYSEAARLFAKARELLVASEARSPLGTGMKIEQSLALWRDNKRPEAILLAGEVLLELGGYDIKSSRQAERAHQYGRGLVGLFSIERSRVAHPPPPFDFGQASQIELSNAPLMGVELTGLADNWRLLACAEADIGGNSIDQVSMAKQEGKLSVIIERDFLKARYAYAVFDGNIENAFRAAVQLRNLAKIPVQADDKFKRAASGHFTADHVDLDDPQVVQLFAFALLDLLSYQVVRGSYSQSFLRRLASTFEGKFGKRAFATAVFEAASQLYGPGSSEAREPFIAYGITLPTQRVRVDAAARIFRDMTTLAHIECSLLREELVPLVASMVVTGWKDLSSEIGGEFQGDISDALDRASDSVERQAAEILLVAKDWVNHEFAEPWFQMLDRLGTDHFGALSRSGGSN